MTTAPRYSEKDKELIKSAKNTEELKDIAKKLNRSYAGVYVKNLELNGKLGTGKAKGEQKKNKKLNKKTDTTKSAPVTPHTENTPAVVIQETGTERGTLVTVNGVTLFFKQVPRSINIDEDAGKTILTWEK